MRAGRRRILNQPVFGLGIDPTGHLPRTSRPQWSYVPPVTLTAARQLRILTGFPHTSWRVLVRAERSTTPAEPRSPPAYPRDMAAVDPDVDTVTRQIL